MRFSGLRHGMPAATIACGIAGTTIAAAPAALAASSAPAARPAVSKVVIVTCAGTGAVRPVRYVIACGDGADFLKGLTWAYWNTRAPGSGKDVINNCKPSCVAGTFHSYPVRVLLWRVRLWANHGGKRRFTRMTLTYLRTIPPGLHRTRTIPLPA